MINFLEKDTRNNSLNRRSKNILLLIELGCSIHFLFHGLLDFPLVFRHLFLSSFSARLRDGDPALFNLSLFLSLGSQGEHWNRVRGHRGKGRTALEFLRNVQVRMQI